MSAGGEASVEMADASAFNSMLNDVRGLEEGYTMTLIIDGSIVQGWKLIDKDPPFIHGWYRHVFRLALDESRGIAEYVGILVSDDAWDIEPCQYVLIQNDNDYQNSGFERFDALWLTRTR